jgi:hypothetical protein
MPDSPVRKRWGKKLKMWASPRGATEDLPWFATESRYGALGNSASIDPVEAPNFSSGSGLPSPRKTAAIFMSALALVPSSRVNVGYSIPKPLESRRFIESLTEQYWRDLGPIGATQ